LSAASCTPIASPALAATLTASDVTTVGAPGTLSLTKLVSNLTQGGAAATAVSANPGDTLQYTLTATNNGAQSLATLVINDATPGVHQPSSRRPVPPACPGYQRVQREHTACGRRRRCAAVEPLPVRSRPVVHWR